MRGLYAYDQRKKSQIVQQIFMVVGLYQKIQM